MRLSLRTACFACFAIIVCTTFAIAQSPEQRTSKYFDSIRKQPPLMLAFLHAMPKGGDLHVHLSGAVYAEDWIDFAASDGLCVERTTSVLLAPPCDPCEKYREKPAIQCAYGDHVLYNQIIDAWSMRNWRGGEESGHDHFFATFDKFNLTSHLHTAEEIATVANRAGKEGVSYIEFMHTADGGGAAAVAARAGWTSDYAKQREALLAAGLKDAVADTSRKLAADDARARSELKCGTPDAQPGCKVEVRYLYQVLRGLSHEIVFAQILLGFELASSDPKVVGLNLVMPEDWYIPIHDFREHMAMLDYLHGVYSKVHISLHAGEIAMGLVKPEDLTYHIRESVERGHAERIGHGVDILNEKDPLGLMKEMADRNVLIEINLTSNDQILGVSGEDHPLPVYIKNGVPVTISTDDQGVARSDMTHEYLRAVEGYNFSYADVKRFARQSLEHSFLPGASLWTSTKAEFRAVAACAGNSGAADKHSDGCEKFLASSERAREQWNLERQFEQFETRY